MEAKKDVKMHTIKDMEDLPMPLFKKCISRDFMHLRDLYIKEEKRHGKGFLMMNIDEKAGKFDVAYYPKTSLPKSNKMHEILEKQTDEDQKKFMNIMAVENSKCVTLRLAKQD